MEQSVYYHITTNIPDGTTLQFQLVEDDGYFSKYDERFPRQKNDEMKLVRLYKKNVVVRNGKASFGLQLEAQWQQMIIDDLGAHIELFWIVYSNKLWFSGKPIYSLLNVSRSLNFLYFQAPVDGYMLPELLTETGEEIIFSLGLSDDVKDTVTEKLDGSKYFIACRILEKGKLVTNTGEIISRKTRVYSYDTYTNDGKFIKVSRASNFGFKNTYVNNGRVVTTKGISQVDYFANKGVINGISKVASSYVTLMDFVDLFKSLYQENLPEIPYPSPWSFAATILSKAVIEPMANEMLKTVYDDQFVLFEKMKQQGLQSCREYVTMSPGAKFAVIRELRIDSNSLRKLLNREFKNLAELQDSIAENAIHTMFYRVNFDQLRDEEIAIVLCIFISEKPN